MDMTNSLPLHKIHVRKGEMIANRLHILIQGIALLALFYYRAITLSRIIRTKESPIIPYILIFGSEIFLTFMWFLHRPAKWRPVKRTPYPERLPEDEKLPRIDVFVCTTDPSKEPSLGVMNTVISAMALDYPTKKIAVYLSDDGGSYVTYDAMKEAWKFAKWWIPFCKKYDVKVRCPEGYFTTAESSFGEFTCSKEYLEEQKKIETKYNELKEALEKNSVNASSSVSRDHPQKIEVINNATGNKWEVINNSSGSSSDSDNEEMPLLVYVAREKKPSKFHNFKAGAINVLLRVSAIISNAPYFLVLDCDHYCSDPTSARQAMCFYVDPEISPKLAWVQFPQNFHSISDHDIYDGRLHYYWKDYFGLDGLRGPNIAGCNFYMKREAIYGTEKFQIDVKINKVKKSFGSSKEFIKSIYKINKPNVASDGYVPDELQKEIQLVASCAYENETEWGKELGFRYFSVAEDTMTSLMLHTKGWISVLIDPTRKCFLGSCTTSLNDMLVQQTRWSFGLMQIALSKVSPLIYGPLKMSPLQSIFYGSISMDPLYVVPFYGLALIPQICLFYGVPLYPKVSDPFFFVFAFVFLSAQFQFLHDIICNDDPIRTWLYEYRVWMMKSGACYFYATLNAILDKIGMNEADFSLTNKDIDNEQAQRYEKGIYDFQVSVRLLAPLCSLYIVNVVAFVIGISRIFCCHSANDLFAQAFISLFGIIVNTHLLEGMIFRQDKGRVSSSTSLSSAMISAVILGFGSLIFIY
ncbi:hypothetical protein ACJIZ3_010669 [Penstemon smallii]|uniref:Uncharacterized protein n=1 Tax=Penstemon smallii TaxID=265156 RepID=A0ABD3UIC6_9LAMI